MMIDSVPYLSRLNGFGLESRFVDFGDLVSASEVIEERAIQASTKARIIDGILAKTLCKKYAKSVCFATCIGTCGSCILWIPYGFCVWHYFSRKILFGTRLVYINPCIAKAK